MAEAKNSATQARPLGRGLRVNTSVRVSSAGSFVVDGRKLFSDKRVQAEIAKLKNLSVTSR